MIDAEIAWLLGAIATAFHLLGIGSSVHAVMNARSPEAAVAWVFALWIVPYVTLPLYWVFGRGKFNGYVKARRAGDLEINHIFEDLGKHAPQFVAELEPPYQRFESLGALVRMPFTRNNGLQLLIDGEQTFDAIFAAIDEARDYILIQFFIVRDDEIGRELLRRLIDKATGGVRVYFLYDEVGCHKLPNSYVEQLRLSGVDVRPFYTTKGRWNRLQVNFRNHRKIVVTDGRTAFVGGLNVGDEYMGRDPHFGYWRDTHVRITGPAVQCVQISFIEDWNWAADRIPQLNWEPVASEEENLNVLVLPTGPADDFATCGLFFLHAINSAKRRVWIASPYFVPDPPVVAALQLAALRGVDVRIMLPEKPDHLLVYLSGFSYIEETEPSGVRFYRYEPGFMHHKVLLVDDDLAAVGTANLDNRSIRLNFEITIIESGGSFTRDVAEMLERDFANCREAHAEDIASRKFWFHVAVQASRLLAPIQ